MDDFLDDADVEDDVDIPGEPLERALDALGRHEDVEALGQVLEAWRRSRSERVAVLVERLSKRLTRGLGPLPFAPRNFLRAPMEPVEVALLLDTAVETAERGEARALADLLKAFGDAAADPRFTPALLAIARLPVARVPEVAQVLCNLLVEMWDPRAVQPLRELYASLDPRSPYAERLDLAIWRLAPRGLPTPRPEEARVCGLMEEELAVREAAERPGTPLQEELLARVYADPEDVAARLVLADHLQEHGDPLGEFIMLQCALQEDRERIARLLAEYGRLWASVLGPPVERARTEFARGFPVAVRLVRLWPRLLPEPSVRWRTVRELDLGGAPLPGLAQWLSHLNLGGVTTLKWVTPALARELAAWGLGVRRLILPGPASEGMPDLFTELARLPRLTRLSIRPGTPEDVRRCAASGLASRLERFEVRNWMEWALVVRPGEEGVVRARLLHRDSIGLLSEALRAALDFGARTLQLQGLALATPEEQQIMRQAASAYARVDWR
ncbi:TIGR02996 domain-containing protein [Pyxidicoccus fallax]|uniref:TIGR02996 domain-containing protein n=1 Tax=Pyxidicoccus fallax TaxID=394095 RepID=A0A848LK50_9BACT|nr:TIGR02996 domain-containing protein [Pyxidicoccus fallax]NMO18076.1 TIGR02996 domain-containing protein [Pyxidicoccus fallax]NPC78582.1 TIGR02996 domain-containing protein [Pyxidicoccus fallax]